MRNAAGGGYQDRLLELIDQVAVQDAGLSAELRKLAVAFEYEKLIELTTESD